MNDHLWHLKFAEYCIQEMKKLCCWGKQQEAQAPVNPDVFWDHLCGMGTQKNLPS